MSSQPVTVVPPTPNPERFSFWQPHEHRLLMVGVDQPGERLPQVLLPINVADMEEGEPSDTAIGQGIYDYLRQFPDCPHNRVYAELLQAAFPHFLTDLASQAILLDAKDVETAYTRRKLTGLKILALVNPGNAGLLLQLCRGYYELSLCYEELSSARRHLLQAMRYGQDLLAVSPDDPHALHLLAEIDVLFGDFPGADAKWLRALSATDDGALLELIDKRRREYLGRPWVESNLVDDLEALDKALELYGNGNHRLSLAILDRLEEEGRFAAELPSADYFYLLGMCRLETDDAGGAIKAFERSLDLDADHDRSQAALEAARNGVAE